MSLSIRHWLVERNIELAQLGHPSAQIAGIAFRIAQDMEVKSLSPFSISALTDVLELPLKAAWQVAEPISQLSVGLLRILSRKKPLRRNEGTWLAFQVAYLNALQGILEQEFLVARPWVDRASVPAGQDAAQPLNDSQLLALLKTLRPGRLSDSQAEQALSLVAESFLVQQMNSLAIAWFIANGAEETEAKLLTQRISNGLPGYLLKVIAENALPLAQLQKFVRLGSLSSSRDATTPEETPDREITTATLPIDLDREYYRADLACSLSEPLLGEPFSLKDLYIPLKGQVLKDEGFSLQNYSIFLAPRVLNPPRPVDLMDWAMSQLEEKTSLAVIEADPGSGKTSFCQMLAYRVSQELYPNWMPVVIQLSKATLGQTLEQTLNSAFPIGRFTDTDGWLSVNSPPCLLILDGLDELPRSSQTQRHLWTFMEQVLRFHSQNTASSGLPRHKLILTSRRATLDRLTRKYRQRSTQPMPAPLQRIAIEPMGQEEFRHWFVAWAKLQSKTIAQVYFSFLKHGGVFQHRSTGNDFAALLTRPLMLYLVGLLHRDAWVDESIFLLNASQAKFEIYDRMMRWLLGESTAGSGPPPELIREGLAHASRSQEAIANLLENRSPQVLRHQMQVAALTMIQTGQYQAASTAIQKRLNGEPTTRVFFPSLPALFFRSQRTTAIWGARATDDNLTTVGGFQDSVVQTPRRYSRSDAAADSHAPKSLIQNPIIEFSHPSFGEYLGAEAIAVQLQAMTQPVKNQYGEVSFVICEAVNVAQHLYTLLSYGLMSAEIEERVVLRLLQEEKRNADNFSFRVLFERLYRFYRAYCRGRWLDEGIAHQAHSQLKELNNPLTALQVDAAVGLNVFLLLCAIAQAAQIPFWPCGNPDNLQEFDADQLLNFINRIAALSPTTFWERARQSLRKVQLADACLNQTMLAEANLWQANLSDAELVGINLAAANLQNANLSWANLAGANLSNANLIGANLEGADLSGANLKGANLTSANLVSACLFQARLDEQAKNFATRSGAFFTLEDFQAYNQSLAPTRIISNLDEDDLLAEEPTIFIESAEGEPSLPDVRYEYNPDDYDGDTAQIENLDQENPAFPDYDDGAIEQDETIRLYDPATTDIEIPKNSF
ncbi:pentapeptide repeat-containing protein [Microcoleus sp. FACHB-SPT15]|uniref:pentapeptide repeat-containing protein n=1 Tax=Microcoleus sp. FACHB-SPT15 TaxID=2692830 RepID=UPI001785301F|nr:pentapeptide repeat-containing protein [Microcoleus sp. FACHB-SPT15]MBD1806146.1 pentapeptide repeat-containing protein [Microcoleus sp. FACHB-SPT15]